MKKNAFIFFTSFIKKHLFLFLNLAFSFFGFIALSIFTPQLFRKFIDGITAKKPLTESLVFVAFLYLALVLLTQVFLLLRSFLNTTFFWKLNEKLRVDLLSHMLNLDMSFFSEEAQGEIAEKIDGDSEALSYSISSFLLDLVANLIIFLSILTIIFFASVKMGCIFSLFSIISFYSLIKFSDVGTASVEKV